MPIYVLVRRFETNYFFSQKMTDLFGGGGRFRKCICPEGRAKELPQMGCVGSVGGLVFRDQGLGFRVKKKSHTIFPINPTNMPIHWFLVLGVCQGPAPKIGAGAGHEARALANHKNEEPNMHWQHLFDSVIKQVLAGCRFGTIFHFLKRFCMF